MFVLTPLVCFIFLFLTFHKKFGDENPCWRTSFLAAAIAWGVLLVLGTELLSLFRGLTFGLVLTFWVIASVIFIKICRSIPSSNASFLSSLRLPSLRRSEVSLLSSLGVVVFLIGLVALIAPPNNWDSLTTHMSRVVHWAQNKTLAYYPTSMVRQLNYPPGSSFAILHFQILSFGDRFANIVQWLAMVGSVLGVSLIAKQLGSDRSGQIFASVAAATIPMGILQASSTQNDYVAAFWLVCFVVFFLKWKEEARRSWVLFAGASLGLAFLVKGTPYFYSLPFIIWLSFVGFNREKKRFCKILLIMAAIVLVILSGFFIRNLKFTGTFFPPSEAENMTIKVVSLPSLISNIVRNLGLHLGTPFENINTAVEKGVDGIHAAMGINNEEFWEASRSQQLRFAGHPFHEDHAGNLLHLFVILLCGFGLIGKKQDKQKLLLLHYFAAVAVGFFLVSIVIKWTPFQSRYHLPVFVLFSPFIGAMLSRGKNRKVAIAVMVVLLIGSLPWVLANQSRPLIGKKNIFNVSRQEQYFWNNPGFIYSFVHAVQAATRQPDCSNIGLWMSANSWEYLFWVLLGQEESRSFRLEHVNVENISKDVDYPLGHFEPCVVVENEASNNASFTIDDKKYVRTRKLAFAGVFHEDPTGELGIRNSLYHFNKSLEYSNRTAAFFKKLNAQGNMAPGDLQQVIALRLMGLNEAKLVDISGLNTVYPGLGDRFWGDFVGGLEFYLNGMKTSNRTNYEEGQRMLFQWNRWLTENRAALQDALRGYK